MAEKFKLQLGLVVLAIAITKSFDTKIGFKQGVDGKLVTTVKILSKHKVESVEDIDRVVQYSELKSYYPLDDDLIEIDAKAIKKSVTTNSETMKVVKIVPRSQVMNYELNGSHYFMDLQKDSKTKKISDESKKLLTMIQHVLKTRDHVLLVAYTSRNIEKYAIIYATPNGLHLSQLINSNLQRDNKQNNLVEVSDDEINMIGDKIMNDMIKDYEKSDTHDHFSDKLKEAIIAKMNGLDFELPEEEEEEDTSGKSVLEMLQDL